MCAAKADEFAQNASCAQEVSDIFEFEFELLGLDVVEEGACALQEFESGS